ncbi:uncharacterized protein LOC129743794 [Uranotaenia lowii]|uniref:uncharacterized protein LOC129743366 n=1 Tax=Uranotaenia lowii TaxID=190385 RepID=UPI0024795A9F|nr:uncharacterized protein LOC129743366 [Uranotaenia lowii]XP_055591961.1 uncharacterized protein LOC129743794 [Uranotaenia lowii]
MHTILLSLLGFLAVGSASLSHPVFGTKRYSRANLLPSSDYGSAISLPVYSPIPQYYDSQPAASQYMSVPAYSMNQGAGADYYDYYNNYYYNPPVHRRHQRQDRHYLSFGLPTYRGEYNPTPYYYAHAPSYVYSDSRESSNPLDDLHEEMLQEDERERAQDFLPVGQEQWYQSPSRHSTDSNFLRDLIMYNNQMASLRGKSPDSTEEYEEYEDAEPEYYDAPYADNRNTYNSFVNPYQSNTRPSTFTKLNNLRNSMTKNAVEDDEEVQELKSLIHQQKNSRLQDQQQLQQQQQFLQPQVQTPMPYQQDFKQQQQRSPPSNFQQYDAPSTSDSWQQDSPQYNNYDYEQEYDDSWSHWDRKRNVQPKKLLPLLLPATTLATTTPKPSTTTPSTTTPTTAKPKVEIINGPNGQKEVVLPRPASPARNPGLPTAQKPMTTVFNMVQQAKPGTSAATGSHLKHPGSVYDTIKKMIDMQQNLEAAELTHQLDSQKHQGNRVQKRFVSSAESLVQQLDGLKRTA